MNQLINTRKQTGKEEDENPFEYYLVLKDRRDYLKKNRPEKKELIRRYDKKILELLPPRKPIDPKTWQPGSYGEAMGARFSNEPDFVAWRKIQDKIKAKRDKATRDRIIKEFEK